VPDRELLDSPQGAKPHQGTADASFGVGQTEHAIPLSLEPVRPDPACHCGRLRGCPCRELRLRDEPEEPRRIRPLNQAAFVHDISPPGSHSASIDKIASIVLPSPEARIRNRRRATDYDDNDRTPWPHGDRRSGASRAASCGPPAPYGAGAGRSRSLRSLKKRVANTKEPRTGPEKWGGCGVFHMGAER
jgi:hypothetical protein